ncbi:uncharacterized protein LOC123877228 [Maniola jurtina]|uniref:uncharacterized protein LOC123877228 n=1 Tax=Maniola jurtina TaxID=191418 RepID=UPI001E687DF4|nr:uncharacterized protein LOC123877228 [Maniola jurtina]
MMPLPFNKTLDLTLMKLVKENPIIYNCKHPKYLDFDTREVVWQKIGDILNRPPQVAKQRWINIRDMMRRKIRDRLRNPSHRSYNYKYEEEMSFMLPYFKETTSNPNDEYSDFFDDPACEVDLPTEFNEQTSFNRSEADPRDVKPNLTYKKRSEDTFSNESRNEFSQELNPTDPIDVFLITVGSTLRKFSPYYLNQAKSKIFQVVQDYELQQIVDKDQPSSSDNNR